MGNIFCCIKRPQPYALLDTQELRELAFVPDERNATTEVAQNILFARLASERDAAGLYEMGQLIHSNESPIDLVRSRKWFAEAARNGSTDSLYMLGLMNHAGKGGPQHLLRARRLLKMAAEKDHTNAQFSLALMHYNGEGAPQNLNRALELFRQAAYQNHAKAQYYLGHMYKYGEGGLENLDESNRLSEARKWFAEAAHNGNTDALCALGLMNHAEKGGPRRPSITEPEVFELPGGAAQAAGAEPPALRIKPAFTQTSPNYSSNPIIRLIMDIKEKFPSLFTTHTPNFLAHGLCTNKNDLDQAIARSLRTALKYPAIAKVIYRNLNDPAIAYVLHKSLNDPKIARIVYTHAASIGNTDAKFYLARMFEKGIGGAQDLKEARRLYKEEAKAKNSSAMHNLARMIEAGKGGPKNLEKAREWFEEAVHAGNIRAINDLACMHFEGKGGPKNLEEAHRLYKIAADTGDDIAISNLARFEALYPQMDSPPSK